MSFLFELPRKEESVVSRVDEIERKMERLIALLEDADLEFAIKHPVSGDLLGNMKGVVPRVCLLDRVRQAVDTLDAAGSTVSVDKARPSDVSSCVSKIKKEQPDKVFKSMSISETETLIVRVK